MHRARSEGKPLILVTLFGGGWHRETERILSTFSPDEFTFAYAYGHVSGVHGASSLHVPHPGRRYPIHYLGLTRPRWSRFIENPVRLGMSLIEALRLVRRLRPDVILSVGTATTIPLFFAGRWYGASCIFVESLTRVERLSVTGRIVYHLRLADRLYVQWERLQARCRRTTYAGAVI